MLEKGSAGMEALLAWTGKNLQLGAHQTSGSEQLAASLPGFLSGSSSLSVTLTGVAHTAVCERIHFANTGTQTDHQT
jgi:hypothetical protein